MNTLFTNNPLFSRKNQTIAILSFLILLSLNYIFLRGGTYDIFNSREKSLTNINAYTTPTTSKTMSYKRFQTFESAEILKQTAILNSGSIISTKGFHYPGDGGAASYKIVSSPSYSLNDPRIIELKNGLYAELIVRNNEIIAEQLGAYGDGIHDDCIPLQHIIDMGYDLTLTSGKTYILVKNGIYIDGNTTINGNGSTIYVNNSYTPQNSNFNYYLFRNKYGTKLDSVTINDVKIEVSFNDYRYTDQSFVVVSPLNIDNITMNNCSVKVGKSINNVVCLWLDNGCSSFSLNNTSLENYTIGSAGGTLWIRTHEDKNFNYFKELKKATISNCYIYGSCGDEVLGLWGTYSINATFKDTTVKGNIMSANRQTRVVSIISQGHNYVNDYVTFDNCEFYASCDKSKKTSYYDSLFGIGTDSTTNKINVSVNGGSIYANVYGAMLFPSTLKTDNVSTYDANNRTVKVQFSGCSINCTSTLTGSNPYYYNTAAQYASTASDCIFDNCNITCNTCMIYLYASLSSKYYVPDITLNSCNVTINYPKSVIYKNRSNEPVVLTMNNTNINAPGINTLFTSSTTPDSTLYMQRSAKNKVSINNCKLNNKTIIQ